MKIFFLKELLCLLERPNDRKERSSSTGVLRRLKLASRTVQASLPGDRSQITQAVACRSCTRRGDAAPAGGFPDLTAGPAAQRWRCKGNSECRTQERKVVMNQVVPKNPISIYSLTEKSYFLEEKTWDVHNISYWKTFPMEICWS